MTETPQPRVADAASAACLDYNAATLIAAEELNRRYIRADLHFLGLMFIALVAFIVYTVCDCHRFLVRPR